MTRQEIYDQARDKIMNEMDIKILRIQNDDLFPLNKTLEKIEAALASPGPLHYMEREIPHPSPLHYMEREMLLRKNEE